MQAALAPAEVAETAAAASALPALAGVGSIALDLRPDTATTEILLTELRQIVLGDLPVVAPAKEPAVAEPATVAEPDRRAVAEPAAVAAKEPATGWAELPESALLDPKKDRDDDVIDVNQPATGGGRRNRPARAPLRLTAADCGPPDAPARPQPARPASGRSEVGPTSAFS